MISVIFYCSSMLETIKVDGPCRYLCTSSRDLRVSSFSLLYLLWLPESDLASSLFLHPVFSTLHPPILPLAPPFFPPPIFFHHSLLIQTYWVRMLSLQQNNEASLPLPSPFLLTIFIICSYIVCLPVCLPVSFSVPHTSVWQPVVSNKKERITKPKQEEIRGRAAGRLVPAPDYEREWAEREADAFYTVLTRLWPLYNAVHILYACNHTQE